VRIHTACGAHCDIMAIYTGPLYTYQLRLLCLTNTSMVESGFNQCSGNLNVHATSWKTRKAVGFA
jgi:hypothetical protein